MAALGNAHRDASSGEQGFGKSCQKRFRLACGLVLSLPAWHADRLEVPIYKSTEGPRSVLIDPFEHFRLFGVRRVMRVGLRFQIGCEAVSSRRRPNRFETRGKWLLIAAASKFQHGLPIQHGFDRLAEARPKLHLSGRGSLHRLRYNARVMHKGIGERHGLTHGTKLA